MTGKVLPLRRVQGTIDELSDRALLSAVGEGDRAALGALYDRFAEGVHGFVARMVGASAPVVDDVVQTTFLNACGSAQSFRGKSSVRSWLYGISANLVREHFRKEARRSEVMALVSREPVDGRATPRRAAELAETRRRLAAAIDQLPIALKEAYVLGAVLDLSGEEAARALGIRTGTLWRRLHDARTRLRALLAGEER